VQAKFIANCSGVLAHEQQQEIIEAVWHLGEKAEPAKEFMRKLTVRPA